MAKSKTAAPAVDGKPASKQLGGKTAARVLVDCWIGSVDQLVHLEPALAEVAEREGYIDTHPNALAGAKRSV